MSTEPDATWLADRLTQRTARGIALEVSGLIRAGALPIGTRMPTVRDLAFRLGVSPGTISEAWSELKRQKIVSGRGRGGAWVSGDSATPRPARMGSVAHFAPDVLDLSFAIPDAALLPPLDAALARAARAEKLNSYERTPILPALRQAVLPQWPYAPDAFLATNGGYNAVYSVLHATVLPGSCIAIEDPTAMRLLDIIEDLGAELLPVGCDAEGPLPDQLAAALTRRPAAFLFQPRTHSVTGRHVSTRRLQELAAVLAGNDTLVIEDDGVGDVSIHPPVSLGAALPERVVHIRSFSKSLGPDLRIAVLSAPDKVIRQIQSYRSFSSGWTSRLLQAATAWLLDDAATARSVAEARRIYAERRRALLRCLAEQGIAMPETDGLCIWIPVESEQYALVTLAAHGIAVLPGSKCSLRPTEHVRLATAILAQDHERVAAAVARAARRLD
ncbi:PLP-dependent aminotransferase family protein [Hyphomicrobiales bacterium]|nr:PLP-dependent aminotransferase family protein [Hyphomicrobiales bacterium]CAH1698640.1 PLP-dependent aminotransferase family protein [Hyphomicrobiales bacterium]CAI0342285.1 PLP-dependent aminotransferase family protein [Hyphomicrobiales bacterium]